MRACQFFVLIALSLSVVCICNGDLVHRYSFTNGDTTAVDSVGGQNGTLSGDAIISGNAVQLDGSGDYVNLPGGLITGFDSVTFEAWYSYTQPTTNWMRVFDFGDTNSGGNGRYYLFYTPRSGSGTARLSISNTDPGYNNEQMLDTTRPSTYTAIHIACVYDGNNNRMTMYTNGAYANSRSVTIPLSAVDNVYSYLGKSLYNDPYLAGAIDEFRIYDHALSASEVESSYDLGPEMIDYEHMASEPDPANNAISVNSSDNIEWTAPTIGPASYTVYISEDSEFASSQVINVTEASCNPELNSETTYYWRVDTNYSGQIYTGVVWQFTTCHSAINSTPAGDLDSDYQVNFQDLVILSELWLNSDNLDTFAEMASNWLYIKPAIIINEFMADNNSTLADPDTSEEEYDDWFELYNRSSIEQNIGGMYLTDDLDEATKWMIPEGVTIEPYGYLVIRADGQTDQGDLHADFKLSSDGEEIGLYDTTGTILIDSVEFGGQYADMSYGRFPDNANEWNLFVTSTPGKCNCEGYDGIIEPVKFSVDGGIFDDYSEAFNVVLSCETPDVVIRYTTDFSEPTESSSEYTGAINVSSTTCIRAAAFKAGWYAAKPVSRSYVFLDDVVEQPARPAGFPSSWGLNLVDYQVDPDVVDNAAYSGTFKDDLQTIPSVCIVIDNDELFDSSKGIYANASERGDAWERMASIEVIDPANNEYYQGNAGLRIHGGAGRSNTVAKHSFRMKFKSMYGPGKLEFPLFEDTDVEAFDQLVLRATWNYSWFGDSTACSGLGTDNAQYMREVYGHDTIRDMGGLESAARHVHVYINGLYWGLYILAERPDESFAAEHLGGDEEDYDVVKTDSQYWTGESSIELVSGDMDAWQQLFALAEEDLSVTANYEAIGQYVDIPALIDYMLMVYHTGSRDAPVLLCDDMAPRNFYAIRKKEAGEGFVFLPWDVEWSLENVNANRVNPNIYAGGYLNPGYLMTRLDDNDEFRMLLADRIHKHYFNDGALTEANTVNRYWDRSMEIDRAIVGESARWGDSRRSTPYTRNNEWVTERSRLINTYLPARDDIVLAQLVSAGYYPSVDAPVFNINGTYQNGGQILSGDTFSMTASGGTIWYTTDGSDPRTGSPVEYTGSFAITESMKIKARTLDGGTWSALNEAVYVVGEISDTLRITEMMYNPADDDAEYIELQNIGTAAINPVLVQFTNGVEFTFPSMTIPAGGYVLVVQSVTGFEAKYGSGFSGIIAGEYSGSLSNSGEQIELIDPLGETIHDFGYSDSWYDITDGYGFSLTIIDPSVSDLSVWDSKEGWRSSSIVDGSPGTDDSGQVYPAGSVVINEVMSHSNYAPNDWVELHNTTSGPIPVGGWFLSDDDTDYMKYRIADGTYIPAGGYLVLTQDDNFQNSSDTGCISPFALSKNGEDVYLVSGTGNQSSGYSLTGYIEQVEFGASDPEVTFGRFEKSSLDGGVDFVAMSSSTPETANAYPLVGPIIINEIMYNPEDGGSYDHDEYEFLELYNISGAAVDLQEYNDHLLAYFPWKFTDGIEYTFQLGVSIPAGGKIVVAKNLAAFAERHPSVSASVVFGPYDGKLSNGGENIELSKPGDEDGGVMSYIRVDSVDYSDDTPWPENADGDGFSLNQISPDTTGSNYGNDLVNWETNNPTPGS